MIIRRSFASFATIGVIASRLAAQNAVACMPPAPGAAFGVTAFNCASCEIHRDKGVRPAFLFNAEPVLLRTAPSSQLQAGDVIEAVNGQPITTRAGADQFTYPVTGENVITVRRGGSRARVAVVPPPVCNLPPDDSTGTILAKDMTIEYQPSPDGKIRGVATGSITEFPPPAGNGVGRARGNVNFASPDGRYGLGVSCQPPCPMTRASDGTDYWKFDAYPLIAELRAGGPAATMGLKVGDLITEVDGISILTEDGALRFLRSERKESLHMTVLRDGKKIGYLLRAP